MAFKLTAPFPIDNTPIYHVDMEDGVMGKANNNGSILLSKDLDPEIEKMWDDTIEILKKQGAEIKGILEPSFLSR